MIHFSLMTSVLFIFINNSDSIIIQLYHLPVWFWDVEDLSYQCYLFLWDMQLTMNGGRNQKLVNNLLKRLNLVSSCSLCGPLAWLHFHFSLSTRHFPVCCFLVYKVCIMYELIQSLGVCSFITCILLEITVSNNTGPRGAAHIFYIKLVTLLKLVHNKVTHCIM